MTDEWNNPEPSDPRDKMSRDDVLIAWTTAQGKLAAAKQEEMDWRKYVVKRVFPNASEGMNTLELGNGYELKAGVKYNYNLINDNKKIFEAQDKISKIGNKGAFIAERLFSWKANFLVTEYRTLLEEKDESKEAQEILAIINSVLTIDEGAPTLAIKEPKVKK